MAIREFDNIKTKDQLGKPDEISIFGPFKMTENFVIEAQPRVVFKRGTADFSKWGTMLWGTDNWYYVDASFVIGDATLGVLGTGVLGVTVEEFVEQQVTSYNNTAIVRFLYEDTVDSANFPVTHSFTDDANTTGTVSYVNQTLTLETSETWTSKSIYKDVDGNNPVVSAILDVTITGSYTYELSADGGANWETVTNQVSHTFTNVGSDLRVRITESTSGFPTAFGTWGSISSESTDLIKVSYTI